MIHLEVLEKKDAMAKNFIKEKQRYHHVEAYLLLGLFSFILLFEVIRSVTLEHTKDFTHWTIFSLIVIVFVFVWWLVLNLRLKINVSKSSLKIQRTPLFGKQYKLLFKDIQNISYVVLTEAARTSGWGVHLDTACKLFDFGDKHGVCISMKNGEEFIIFSDLLYERRHQLEKIIELQSGKKV